MVSRRLRVYAPHAAPRCSESARAKAQKQLQIIMLHKAGYSSRSNTQPFLTPANGDFFTHHLPVTPQLLMSAATLLQVTLCPGNHPEQLPDKFLIGPHQVSLYHNQNPITITKTILSFFQFTDNFTRTPKRILKSLVWVDWIFCHLRYRALILTTSINLATSLLSCSTE